jgi:hypothetical protein
MFSAICFMFWRGRRLLVNGREKPAKSFCARAGDAAYLDNLKPDAT